MKEKSRQRCYVCFRPQELCYCGSIPRVCNSTQVLILQHVAERFHPFNTARIVRRGLLRCDIVVGHNRDFSAGGVPIHPDAVLLYPGDESTQPAGVLPPVRPSQLVVVDGTWHQAKTIVRDCRQLQALPRLRLAPPLPGRYRIRREPNPQSLSTVEATVQALALLEPETRGLDQLLNAFETMVTGQMERRREVQGTRHKFRTGRLNNLYPRALFLPASQLVVAYGESTPKLRGGSPGTPAPVNWVAQRLATGDRFERHLETTSSLPGTVREHMRLTDVAGDMCCSTGEFRRAWRAFLRPNDVLVVYHARTAQLLQRACGSQPRTMVLKSICGKTAAGSGSLNEVLRLLGLAPVDRWGPTRAHHRLAMAVALAEYFRERTNTLDSG
ncbi:MAG: tRNA-uridine aminocarboxypropyltransferase [Planctomycetota bacterium]|nr:tRNA-uridine aminocarboxypropyltransferase [Planctomycetota bacterium]